MNEKWWILLQSFICISSGRRIRGARVTLIIVRRAQAAADVRPRIVREQRQVEDDQAMCYMSLFHLLNVLRKNPKNLFLIWPIRTDALAYVAIKNMNDRNIYIMYLIT